MFLFCVCERVTPHTWRGQRTTCSLLPLCGSGGETPVLRLGSGYLYQRSHPSLALGCSFEMAFPVMSPGVFVLNTPCLQEILIPGEESGQHCVGCPLRLSSHCLLQALGTPSTSTFIPTSSEGEKRKLWLSISSRQGRDQWPPGWGMNCQVTFYIVSSPPPWWKSRLRQWSL